MQVIHPPTRAIPTAVIAVRVIRPKPFGNAHAVKMTAGFTRSSTENRPSLFILAPKGCPKPDVKKGCFDTSVT